MKAFHTFWIEIWNPLSCGVTSTDSDSGLRQAALEAVDGRQFPYQCSSTGDCSRTTGDFVGH